MRTPADVLTEAARWIGTGEDPPGSNHNRFTDEYGLRGPWCNMFTTHCMAVAGLPEERYASTVLDVANGRAEGRFIEGAHGGQPGDLVFFHWPSSSRGATQPDHVGLVEKVLGDGVYQTIEGNVGDRVQRLVRRANILGFKRPRYDAAPPPPPPAAPPPKPAGRPYPGRLIKRGARGDDVRWVQQHVGAAVDGVFGRQTLAAVRAFQRHHGLSVDGVVGPKTWAALGG